MQSILKTTYTWWPKGLVKHYTKLHLPGLENRVTLVTSFPVCLTSHNTKLPSQTQLPCLEREPWAESFSQIYTSLDNRISNSAHMYCVHSLHILVPFELQWVGAAHKQHWFLRFTSLLSYTCHKQIKLVEPHLNINLHYSKFTLLWNKSDCLCTFNYW